MSRGSPFNFGADSPNHDGSSQPGFTFDLSSPSSFPLCGWAQLIFCPLFFGKADEGGGGSENVDISVLTRERMRKNGLFLFLPLLAHEKEQSKVGGRRGRRRGGEIFQFEAPLAYFLRRGKMWRRKKRFVGMPGIKTLQNVMVFFSKTISFMLSMLLFFHVCAQSNERRCVASHLPLFDGAI